MIFWVCFWFYVVDVMLKVIFLCGCVGVLCVWFFECFGVCVGFGVCCICVCFL